MQAALNNNLTQGAYSGFLNDYCFTQVESKKYRAYVYGANNPVMMSDPSGRNF